jgi:hypothetical protein
MVLRSGQVLHCPVKELPLSFGPFFSRLRCIAPLRTVFPGGGMDRHQKKDDREQEKRSSVLRRMHQSTFPEQTGSFLLEFSISIKLSSGQPDTAVIVL